MIQGRWVGLGVCWLGVALAGVHALFCPARVPPYNPVSGAEVANSRGHMYLRAGLLPEAVTAFTHAIERDETMVSAYYSRAKAFLQLRRPDQALADYSKVIALDVLKGADLSNVHCMRGLLYYQRGQYEEALGDFSRALELGASDPRIHPARGRAYLRLGRLDEAISDLSRAIEAGGEDSGLYLSRAQAWIGKEDEDRALADISRAIRAAPDPSQAYMLRASIHGKNGSLQKAHADLTQAVNVGQANKPRAHYYRGTLRMRLKRQEDALADFTAAIALDPRYGWAYYMRGHVRLKTGDAKAALDDLNRAAEIMPKESSVYVQRVEAHLRAGNVAAAKADAKTCISLGGRIPAALAKRLE